MENKINVVKIFFGSKKALQLSETNKRNVKGIAYFIFDYNWKKCLRQIPFLTSGEYRPNDPDMMKGKNGKGTRCWMNIGEERKKLFPISLKNNETKTLTKKQISQINAKALREWNTILTLDKWLSGSNPSGAEHNFTSTPYLINEKKNYGFVFINCFKKFKSKKEKVTVSDWEFLKTNAISLAAFLDKNNQFKQEFLFYNDAFLEEKERRKEKDTLERIFSKKEAMKQIINDYQKKSKQLILMSKNKKSLEDSKSLETKLRRNFAISLKTEAKLKKINNSYLENDSIYDSSNIEAAHIVSVKKAKENNKLEWIFDHQNGLLISANLHQSYDHKRCHFNSEYKIVSSKDEKQTFQLKQGLLNTEREKYIQMVMKNISEKK